MKNMTLYSFSQNENAIKSPDDLRSAPISRVRGIFLITGKDVS